MLRTVAVLACLVAVSQAMRHRQRAESIDGRVELEYLAKITAVRKVIRETEFATSTQIIVDSPYCVSYPSNLEPCTPTPIAPSKTTRRVPKSLFDDSVGTPVAPSLESSIQDQLQVIELEGIREECMNQNKGVTFLTTIVETQTITVTKTQPGAQTVTISIDGCLPNPMPFNAPQC